MNAIYGVNENRLKLEDISVGDMLLFPDDGREEYIIKKEDNLLVTTRIRRNPKDMDFPAIKDKIIYRGNYINYKSKGKVYKQVKINTEDYLDYLMNKFF